MSACIYVIVCIIYLLKICYIMHKIYKYDIYIYDIHVQRESYGKKWQATVWEIRDYILYITMGTVYVCMYIKLRTTEQWWQQVHLLGITQPSCVIHRLGWKDAIPFLGMEYPTYGCRTPADVFISWMDLCILVKCLLNQDWWGWC